LCSDGLPIELASFVINMATNRAAAEIMSEGNMMRQLLERAYQTHDAMLLKLLRNLTIHEGPALQCQPYASDLFALVQQVEGEELLVEVLGLLANLRLRKLIDLPQLVARFGIVEFIQRQLVAGFAEDDLLLEVVILASEVAANDECATHMLRAGVVFIDDEHDSRAVSSLYSLLTEKMEDDEFVLQLLIAFYRLLQADEPREALLQHTQIVIYLLDLLLDNNKEIKRVADLALDAVAEADEQWASQIRERKFALHNQQWLELVDEDEAEEYQDALALNNAMQSLHLQAPLDASQLEGDDYGEGTPLSPGSDSLEHANYMAGYEHAYDHAAAYAERDAAGYAEPGYAPGYAEYAPAYAEHGMYEQAAYEQGAYEQGGYEQGGYEQPGIAGYGGALGYGIDSRYGLDAGYADGDYDEVGYAEPAYGGYGAHGRTAYGDYGD